jgi:hypothetical protein
MTDIIKKHCPYCRAEVKIYDGQKTGICGSKKCEKKFEIRYRLSCITLEPIIIYRDFDTEIYDFIIRKRKTCTQDITKAIKVSKGKISQVITKLEIEEKIEIDHKGKTKWIKIK